MKLKLQGWRGPASFCPHLSIPLTRVPKPPLRSPPSPLLPVAPRRRAEAPWGPPLQEASPRRLLGVTLASLPPRPHSARWWGRGSGPARVRGAQAQGLGASAAPGGACARGRVGECARARGCVCRSPSPVWAPARSRGPPVSSFPVLSPGPHRVETGHLVKRCFWPSGRRGDRRRKAPRLEFFSIKSDKKFREK